MWLQVGLPFLGHVYTEKIQALNTHSPNTPADDDDEEEFLNLDSKDNGTLALFAISLDLKVGGTRQEAVPSVDSVGEPQIFNLK